MPCKTYVIDDYDLSSRNNSTKSSYLLNNKNNNINDAMLDKLLDSTSCNAILYFLMIFTFQFQQGANKLQDGQANLTEAMEKLVQLINVNKDNDLEEINKKIHDDIEQCNKDQKDSDKLAIDQRQLTDDEQEYKTKTSEYQSKIQTMTTIAQQDTDTTTSISQVNSSNLFQIASNVMNILLTLNQLIMR